MKVTFSLFPKFYSSLDVKALAALVRGCGLDAVNAVVREGYWVEPDTFARDLPAFTEAVRAEGVDVHFATTAFSAESLDADATPLKVMADAGIRDFRMQHFREEDGNLAFDVYTKASDPRAFWIFEVYRDDDAFRTHVKAPYGAPFNAALAPLIEEDASALTFLDELD